MSGQFSPIEPYDSGMLDVGDQHRVYWTSCRLRVIDDVGHGGGNSFVAAVVDALNALASA